ncbi:MAG: UDP-N-acetylmuramate--L-alanine ligase, partial [Oscillospiraceae bacterium]|nr:UDP-N-acetylmuramate--L-alanine ligase [Oscillospiraceae bacterium]
MENFLKEKKHVHFIGIGGSGMYPLAQILHMQGYYLTGSDNNETTTLEAVRSMGIPVMMGQCAENIKGADLIVYSAAIMEDNPELVAAREAEKNGVTLRERSDLLGLVTSQYKSNFCVSGTHGKTTVTSMLTMMLLAAGIDASAVIGGKLRAIGGSGRAGNSDYMVCEACEFKDTFLKLFPRYSVVLNIDRDHMDYFKNMDNLKDSFRRFCEQTSDAVVANGDDENVREVMSACVFNGKFVTFGKSADNDFYPEDIRLISDFRQEFSLMHKGSELCRIGIN